MERPTRFAFNEFVVRTYENEEWGDSSNVSQCSDCHAIVPTEMFQQHVDWHGTLLHAHPDIVAQSRRERN